MTTKTTKRPKRLPVIGVIGKRPAKKTIISLTAVAAFAVIGIAYLASSNAATYTAQLEAEAGTITGNASSVTDGSASGGQAIKFTAGISNPPDDDPQNPGVPTRQIKIMPFGSSTVVGNAPGGFRPRLYQRLTQEDKLNVDFVGSQSSGDASLPDKNHEGHSGWLIGADGQSLNGSVVGWLNTYKPDVMLFYAGTNDITGGASAATTTGRMDAMAAKIFQQSPNLKLIVGTLIQVRPLDGAAAASCRTFNASLEGIAAKYRAQGRYMQIVDTGGALGAADYPAGDNIHTNQSGYNKIADVFLAGVRATYSVL